LTGDGAGILIQMPHKFLKKEAARIGIDLPEPGRYGSGLVFFSRKIDVDACVKIFEDVVDRVGLRFLGWREVPVDNSTIGQTARSVEPVIRQVFIGASDSLRSR
ncbi:MAG: hypothetical protein GWM98_05665, partial [Nitrospinaceae bacterium]|nr:hypothetical protein [Nitrospinaceae bacterium]NIR54048.1 hypothetical protein [Nitrospinaceae bacterium]NIS84465.1 hypothetical protein [Nitrospinaceae bacterium]NIT81261.1 hypothetical protein [Nitrospinaceae bacterium]NIU43548.1 hypothetical protein [Nitrospinaceae bacterium]